MPYLDTSSGRLFYRAAGDGGSPLVLLHGFGGTHRVWRAVQNELSDTCTSYALDLRGAGRSARPGSYRLAEYVSDLTEAVDQLGLSRLSLVGYSMGALIAAAWAAAHAYRMDRLVLVAPAPLDGVPPGQELQASHAYERIQARRSNRSAQLVDLRRSSPRTLPERVLKMLIEDDRSWDPVAVQSALDSVGGARTLQSLGRSDVPVLMVAGDRDRLLPYQLADAGRLPKSALQVFYRVGHLLPLEVPALLSALIEEFMIHGARQA